MEELITIPQLKEMIYHGMVKRDIKDGGDGMVQLDGNDSVIWRAFKAVHLDGKRYEIYDTTAMTTIQYLWNLGTSKYEDHYDVKNQKEIYHEVNNILILTALWDIIDTGKDPSLYDPDTYREKFDPKDVYEEEDEEQ